jgi:hypothetical protein
MVHGLTYVDQVNRAEQSHPLEERTKHNMWHNRILVALSYSKCVFFKKSYYLSDQSLVMMNSFMFMI